MMAVMACCRARTAFVALLAILSMFLSADAAQVAKKPGAKEQANKSVPVDDNSTWLLAGREGECAPTSILERKGPEYKNIQTPHQLVEKLRAAGHKAEMKEFKAGTRPAVEVRAPSAGLAVMFVKKEFCDKVAPAPDKKK